MEQLENQKFKTRLFYVIVKRGFDFCAALIGIIILIPFFLLITVLIKIEDQGSVFYRQQRMGRNGKCFSIYKFRSMVTNADKLENLLTQEQKEQYYSEFKIPHDPRVTRVGYYLRCFSLDELPQFINILKGEMSFVGPRPILAAELQFYTEEEQEKLLSVPPGLTGYWQAYARNDASYKSGKRQAMELYYIDHASFTFDIQILMRTVVSVIKKAGVV